MSALSAPRSATRLSALFALFLTLVFASSASAQQSNGYTYYRLAGATSTDTQGNVLTGSANGTGAFTTDGSTVVFLNRTGANAGAPYCSSGWGIYSTPVQGGAITPLILGGSGVKVEPSVPNVSVVSLCDAPLISGNQLIYGAGYTYDATPVTPGTFRNGFFVMPLTGGTSADLVATGDTAAGVSVATVLNGGQSTNPVSMVISPQSTTLPDGSFYGWFFNVGDPYIVTLSSSGAATFNKQSISSCSGGFTLSNNSPASWSSNNSGLYATATGLELNTGYHTVAITSSSPNLNCSNVVFDPYAPDPVFTTSYYRLPNNPLPTATGYPTSASINQIAVASSTTYILANQTYGPSSNNSTTFYGIYALASGAINTSLVGPNNIPHYTGNLVPLWTSAQSLPGIDPSLQACSASGVSTTPTATGLIAAGNYVVFEAFQRVQDCNTQAVTTHGGVYAYDLTAKTFTRVVDFAATLTQGEVPLDSLGFWALRPGELSADGHLVFSSVQTKTGANTPTASVLYSVYIPQIVTGVTLNAPSTSTFAGNITLTAKVTPNTGATVSGTATAATGNVNFYSGTTLLGTSAIDSSGTATLTTNTAPTGNNSLTAVYVGDTNYMGATSAASPLAVAQGTAALALNPMFSSRNPIPGPSTITVSVVSSTGGTPTGSVALYYNGLPTSLPGGTLNGSGVASFIVPGTLLCPGACTIPLRAVYSGDANFPMLTASGNIFVVNATTLTTALNPTAPTYGTATTLTVTANEPAASAPANSVTWSLDNGAKTGTTSLGVAIPLGILTAGSHSVAISYTGDTNYSAQTATASFIVAQAPLTVAINPATRAYGAANPTFTATVTGILNSDNIVPTYDTPATISSAPGTYSIAVNFHGNPVLSNYVITSPPGTLTITKANSSLKLNGPASAGVGASVAISAVIAPASGPTGTVAFYNNGSTTSLGIATLSNGVATLTTTALPSGTDNITAIYMGDVNFSASPVSSALPITIGTPDYTITASPSSATIAAGQSATFTFTVTPVFGFTTPISFACTSLPSNATCTFTPSTLTPAGSPLTTTLVIATNVKTSANSIPDLGDHNRFGNRSTLAFAAALLLLPFARRRSKLGRLTALLFILTVGATLATITGCGGSSPASTTTTTTTTTTTPTGAYTVSVGATAGAGTGSTAHSASLSVTITN